MTNRLSRLLWPALAVATLALSSVAAEAAEIRANVPFDFTVKGKSLAAGKYEITETRGVVQLRSEKDEAGQALARVLETVQATNQIAQKLGVTRSPFARRDAAPAAASPQPAPHE